MFKWFWDIFSLGASVMYKFLSNRKFERFDPNWLLSSFTDVAVENIKRLNENKRLKEYKPSNPVMVLPLGRSGGVSQLPNGMVVGGFVTKSIKGKDVMTADTWKAMKKKMPSD